VPPFEIGKVLEGGAVGEVIESRAKDSSGRRRRFQLLAGGNISLPHRKTCIRSAKSINRSRFISGALGMTGMTAWAGLNLVEVKAGDVIYISGAAGAVGNVAGQLAKLRGMQSHRVRRFHGEGDISARGVRL